MKSVLARLERRQQKNYPSLFNEASARPQRPKEQQRLEELQQLEEQTLDLIKYYTYDTSLKDSRYGILFNDSRCSIDFSEKKLIEILVLFAKLNNHSRDSTCSNPPFFGFSESCFTDFLIYALNKRPGCEINQELERSMFGKNLIRNLLHTASTFTLDPASLKLIYKTESAAKAYYIRLFKDACKKAEEPSVEISVDCTKECYTSRPAMLLIP